MITDRLPRESDADKNGEVFGYTSPNDFAPVPFPLVRLNPGGIFIGWRNIKPADYLNSAFRTPHSAL
jgi:hypothetical protein